VEDIIKHILDIDRQARETERGNDNIQKKAEDETAEKIRLLRERYKKTADEKIAVLLKSERESAETKLPEKSEKNRKLTDEMNRKYEGNAEFWAEQIFKKTIES